MDAKLKYQHTHIWFNWARIFLALIMVLASVGQVTAYEGVENQIYTTGERQQFTAPDGQIFWMEEFSILPSSSKSSSGIDLTASRGCHNITHGINMYNAYGSLIWKYSWIIDWCFNGSRITSLNPRRVVNIYMPGWSFKGDTRTVRGGVNQWNYYHLTQGDMCLIDYGNCIWHTYPTVEQDVNGVGNFSGRAWY